MKVGFKVKYGYNEIEIPITEETKPKYRPLGRNNKYTQKVTIYNDIPADGVNPRRFDRFVIEKCLIYGGFTEGADGTIQTIVNSQNVITRDIERYKSPLEYRQLPADEKETKQAIKYAAEHNGPVYVRIARTNLPDVVDENYEFNPTKAVIMKEGTDVTLITNGETLVETIDCAKILHEKGINAEVINIPVVKPIDAETIINSAKKTNRVITIENHSIIGGLGSAVCEVLSETYPVKITRIGTNDEFGQSGTAKELMAHYGLNCDKLTEKIMGLLK